jgi:hypothetical protein
VCVPEFVLQVRTEGAGQHLDDARDRIDLDDAAQCGGVEHDPAEHRCGGAAHAAAPTGDGEWKPSVVADLQDRATCSVVVGRTTTSARRGTCPASAQCRPSGHQSRLASATASRWDPSASSVSQIDASASIASSGTSTDGPASRESLPSSSIGGVGDVGTFDSCILFVGAQTPVGVELTLDLVGRPVELLRDERSDGRRGGEAGAAVEQVRSRAAGEDVVERGGHLVTHGVDGLGAEIRLAGHQRLAEVGTERDERPDLVGDRAVPVRQVVIGGAWPLAADRPACPEQLQASGGRASGAARGAEPAATTSTVSSAIAR